MRRTLVIIALVTCAAVVIGYQGTRPTREAADPKVFVPSAQFFKDFSPGFRTTIADLYYLSLVQYYGQHSRTDQRFDSVPPMVDLVVSLSPRFIRPYLFGSFAILDAGEPGTAYDILERGYAANPDEWHLPAMLGFFAYTYATNKDKAAIAASWYEKASRIPGRPQLIPRLAAALTAKGGDEQRAVLMWGQVYADGDKYSRKKAIAGLDRILPVGKQARMKALAPLVGTMPEDEFDQLIAELFKGYT